MLKLYELASAFRRVVDEIDEAAETGEEKNDSHLKEILDTLDMAVEKKIEGCAKVIKMLDATADAIKKEEERLARRRKSAERSIEWLKIYVRDTMLATEKRKIKTELFTIYLQNKQPSVLIDDIKAIPKRFFKEPKPPEIDKKKLKEALKSGEATIPGCRLDKENNKPSLVVR